jgi:gamma-glutamyltranspeptidase/glutathione hydrolase
VAVGLALWTAPGRSQDIAVVPPSDIPATLPSFAATAPQSMVATVHPLATDAALAAFDRGGNAVDAAIAAALMLGVVDGFNSGIGGGCFVLVRTPDGEFHALDGRERAPHAAARDMFLRDGEADGQLSVTGPLAVAVPGALAGYELAVRQFGQLPFASLVESAADVAEDGFIVDQSMAIMLRDHQTELRAYSGNLGNLLAKNGEPLEVGMRLRQPDLATSYRAIARDGIEWFYRGPFAAACDDWFAKHGGILTAEDLADYRPRERRPLLSEYRGYQIVGLPPPSSGGVHVAQILNMLETFPLSEIFARDPAQAQHIVVEAMKRAFADRAHWLGDPDFTSVPAGLIDRGYATQLARQIDVNRATPVAGHGDPLPFDSRFFGKHTTHIAAADRTGYWVAITTTVNTSFGSKVVVPGTGIILNNQMDDFSIAPDVPNAFGLIGAEANAIAPGKRPLSSMSPTLVCRDGQPVLTLGAAGGPTIISQVVWTIVRYLDFHESLPAAVGGPRLHHQWSPDFLYFEASCDLEMTRRLAGMGHMMRRGTGGVCQAIGFDARSGRFLGVHDPRVPGKAAGR